MLTVTLFHSIMKLQKHFDPKESLTLLASISRKEPVCTSKNIRMSAPLVFSLLTVYAL